MYPAPISTDSGAGSDIEIQLFGMMVNTECELDKTNVIQETHLLACLQGAFQDALTEMGGPTLNMSITIPSTWGFWAERKERRAERQHPCHATRCLTLLPLRLPDHGEEWTKEV